MRDTLLLAALVWAGAVQAAPLPSDAPRLVMAQAAPSPSDDEDEEDPAPAATTPTTPATTTPASPAKADAPSPVTTEPAPAANAEQQRLVSGAPLYNPNVAVHIVEQKAFSDAGKREIVLFPAMMQVNGKFTQHFGTMGSFVWHLKENFGLQITGGYNWYNVESAFNGELVEKFRVEAQAATSLLWTWGVMGGVEVTPLYAKFAFFEGTLGSFSVVLNGGAGAGGTRHQLKPASVATDGTETAATYGDTGARFMGSLGAGFRFQLGERFALRLEVRDVVYTARMERVNGCNVDDLRAMDAEQRRGAMNFDRLRNTVGDGCLDSFEKVDETTGQKSFNDVPLALNLVRTPSSDVLNNVGLYLGASFLF